jgi:HAD superfamily hydrolase (TIGR01484 family)
MKVYLSQTKNKRRGKMRKLVVFDIDNTLAKPGRAISQNVAEKLAELRDIGIKIALISGKPAFYIAGFVRGAGLKDMLIAGENGGVIFNPSTLETKYIEKRPASLDVVEKRVTTEFGTKIWLQPNEIILTIFPRKHVKISDVEKYVRKVVKEKRLNDVYVLTHADAIDVMPKSLNKGLAVKYFCKFLRIPMEQVAAVGDSESDIPMFESSGFSIAVGGKSGKAKSKASIAIDEITSAIDILLKRGKESSKWLK